MQLFFTGTQITFRMHIFVWGEESNAIKQNTMKVLLEFCDLKV